MSKSFTTRQNPTTFTIDDEEFTTVRAVPAGLMADLADIDAGEATAAFFNLILDEDSAARFLARMRDKANPIDSETAVAVTKYLYEEMSARPTELPSGSPDGSEPTGPSSTESAPTEE